MRFDVNEQSKPECGLHASPSSELVMGVQWDPPQADDQAATADLDAICVLIRSDGSLECIHPGVPCGASGSVVHTGDSTSGASIWDDERVFVFLDALPGSVNRIAFIVCSVTGQPFNEIRRARCHISDRQTEAPWLRVDLTTLVGRTEHVVACLERTSGGWRLADATFDSKVWIRPQ